MPVGGVGDKFPFRHTVDMSGPLEGSLEPQGGG